MDEAWGGDVPRVEFLILAEHVEAIHGRLYLMGGAWETIHVSHFDVPVALSMAVSVQVPWNATNQQHTVAVTVQTVDGDVLTAEARQIMVGRPTHVEPGTSQRTLLVLSLSVNLPKPDRYVVVASIDENPQVRVSFRAVAGHVHA